MTVGEGIPFARKLAIKLGKENIVAFEKFGTALIPGKNFQIEVATARKEAYDSDSSLESGSSPE